MNSEERLPLLLREGRPGDWPFVASSWRKSSVEALLDSVGLNDRETEECRWPPVGVVGLGPRGAHNEGDWKTRTALEQRLVRLHKAGVESLRPVLKLLVAAAEDAPDEILGYVAYQRDGAGPLTLHWTYVKMAVRRFGIASQLLGALRPGPGSIYTLPTRSGARLAEKFELKLAPWGAGRTG